MEYETSSLTLAPTRADEDPTVTVSNQDVESGNSSALISLLDDRNGLTMIEGDMLAYHWMKSIVRIDHSV